jgi:hypothetical protein
MSETKAPNVVSAESLQRKLQWLKDHNIDVPTIESILAEREAAEAKHKE